MAEQALFADYAAPTAGGPDLSPGWAQRLDRLESFDDQAATAIDSLVTSVLGLQDRLDHLAAPAQDASALADLSARLQAIEGRLALEAMTRDIRQVSAMHPKRRIAVFVGRSFLCDNVKYAWLALTERAQALGIDCWFLPLSEGAAASVQRLGGGHCLPPRGSDWTAEHLQVLLGAAVLVLDNHFLDVAPQVAALLHGARQVQLWHGIGIKDVGFANLPPMAQFGPHTARLLNSCGPFASFVSTAACMEPEWRRSFAFERYVVAGYARNDVLLREPTWRDLENVDQEALARMRAVRDGGRRVFLYAPTFRDARLGDWIADVDLAGLARGIRQRGDLLVVNLHPVEQPRVPQLRAAMPEVCFVRANTDVYPLLGQTDALITDYSSILFDYLLLDRPVIQFQPDLGAYLAQSRRLHDDKDTSQLGHVVHATGPLDQLLAGEDLETPEQRAKRHELTARLHQHRDGRCAERACDLVAEEIERAMAACRGG